MNEINNVKKERARLEQETWRRAKGIQPRKPGRTIEEKKAFARELYRRTHGKHGSRAEWGAYCEARKQVSLSGPSYYVRKGKFKRAEYAANRKKRMEQNPAYKEYNRKRRNARDCIRMKERRKTDVVWKIHKSVSETIRRTLIKGYSVKTKRTTEYLGCTIPQLKSHLEFQFEPWMNWNNRGMEGWHIDHIIPFKFFQDNNLDPRWCWHYTNLQPLSGKENSILKSDNIIKPFIHKVILSPDAPDELKDVALALCSY